MSAAAVSYPKLIMENVSSVKDGEMTVLVTSMLCAFIMLCLIIKKSMGNDNLMKKPKVGQAKTIQSLKIDVFGISIEIKARGAAVINAVKVVYPGAIENASLVSKVSTALEKYGYNQKNTLLASSLCCDEVNRELEKEFAKKYGDNFSMGGLAGFPFCGKTSFGAMAHHIPQDGSCLIVYGPHVGIDSEGNIGKVNRRGRPGSGACCGSATAAAAYVKGVKSGSVQKMAVPNTTDDAQQVWVSNMLLPYVDRLTAATNEAAELPLCLFSAQEQCMEKIVSSMCGEVAGVGKIALLGGIQINTPEGTPDFFLPLKFEVRNNKGKKLDNLINKL